MARVDQRLFDIQNKSKKTKRQAKRTNPTQNTSNKKKRIPWPAKGEVRVLANGDLEWREKNIWRELKHILIGKIFTAYVQPDPAIYHDAIRRELIEEMALHGSYSKSVQFQ